MKQATSSSCASELVLEDLISPHRSNFKLLTSRRAHNSSEVSATLEEYRVAVCQLAEKKSSILAQ